MHLPRLLCVVLAMAGLFAFHPARAAQSYDNCAGTITALPTVITTQGVWCMKKDLATAITDGNAIEIQANNVTIDCNDFKLGGLGAGNGSTAVGIYAAGRQNATIRHCNIRGFYYGIRLNGGAGQLVEDNRLDNNLYMGMQVMGENGRVRHNAVYDTGGKVDSSYTYGIYSNADIVGNTVSGLFADASGGILYGINAFTTNDRIEGNLVTNFDTTATSGGSVTTIRGIANNVAPAAITGNRVFGPNMGGTIGIYSTDSFCMDNIVVGFGAPFSGCNVTNNAGADTNMTTS